MFIVIHLIKDDSIFFNYNKIRILGRFNTREEAVVLVELFNSERDKSWKAFYEYVRNYVANLILPPKGDSTGWKDFQEKYHYFCSRKYFKQNLEFKLLNFHYLNKIDDKNYQPPKLIDGYDEGNNLFIVDVENDKEVRVYS